jgi:putative transposase
MRDYHAHLEIGNYYHIYNRGNNGENIFLKDENFDYFLSKWIKYIDPYSETFAYCLMPNHFHFLIRVDSKDCFVKPPGISKVQDPDINLILESQFKKLFSSYALAFNNQQSRHGSLFEKRFKRVLVDSDSYLSKIIHYIHNNPLHHGFADDFLSWKYCSYRSILSEQPTRVSRNEVLEWLGGKKGFIDFHKVNINYSDIKDVAIDA